MEPENPFEQFSSVTAFRYFFVSVLLVWSIHRGGDSEGRPNFFL